MTQRLVEAHSLLRGARPAALVLLDPVLTDAYARPVRVRAYDPREIVAEKGRAILTRQAAKVRDVLDLYFLERTHGVRLEDHLGDVERKTHFVLDRATRYGERLDLRRARLDALVEEDVRPYLLRPVDGEDFDVFRRRAVATLDRLAHGIAAEPEAA